MDELDELELDNGHGQFSLIFLCLRIMASRVALKAVMDVSRLTRGVIGTVIKTAAETNVRVGVGVVCGGRVGG